jgi:6-pyruvoyltetrahydropterin/6-carboxytetrahydropterin synthase
MFFASHRLHSPLLSVDENRAVYGKCNNPFGHGHNYELELTVAGEVDPITGRAVALHSLDRFAENSVIAALNYQNLNELEMFRDSVPTTENLASKIMKRLSRGWKEAFGTGSPRLESIRILETERNICEVAVNDEKDE